MSIDLTGPQFVAHRLGLLPWEPPLPKRGERYGPDARCWLCGGATDGVGWHRRGTFAPTFTNVNIVTLPSSQTVCQACVATSSGEAWQRHAARRPDLGVKTTHPISWRSYSHAVTATTSECPSRPRWRDLLLEPPDPPFVFAIAISGQKHILFRSRIAHDREAFPVQVEEESVWLERPALASCLAAVEALLALGFGREAIERGAYPQHHIQRAGIQVWREAERRVASWRRQEPTALLLACRFGRRPEAGMACET